MKQANFRNKIWNVPCGLGPYWLYQLYSVSLKGLTGLEKMLQCHYFSPLFLSQSWCQTFVRLFVVFLDFINLPCLEQGKKPCRHINKYILAVLINMEVLSKLQSHYKLEILLLSGCFGKYRPFHKYFWNPIRKYYRGNLQQTVLGPQF